MARFFAAFRKDKRLGIAQGRRSYDLPLNKSMGTEFLVVLIALMGFLTIIAATAFFALNTLARHWSSGLEHKVTIEISAETHEGTLRTPGDIEALQEKAAGVLKASPYVKNVTIMTDQDMKDLLAPWLGRDGTLGALPLPGLIALELTNSTPETLQKLEKDMALLHTDIKVDTHEAWLGDLLRLTDTLQFTALAVMLVIGATTVTAIAGAMRTRMALHKEEIELLHLMGARDEYITRQLQRHALIIALKGSIAGLLASIIVLIAVTTFSAGSGSLIPGLTLSAHHIIVLMLIPGAICLIATSAARFTVLRVLAMMP